MAKDKKSFLLYCDVIHTIEQLTDEQAGDLFKHILRYVNDLNPQSDSVITKIAFEPIRQALKRDLDKYESIRKRNSDNARMRWDATASSGIPNDTKNADRDIVIGSDIDKDIKKLTNNHWSCVPDEKPETWNRYFAYMMKEENVLETSFSKDKLDEFSQSCKEEWNRIQKEQRSVINKTARKKVTDRETHYQNIMLKLKEDEIWKPEQVYEVDKDHERPETLTCHEPNYSRRFDEVLDYVITEYEDEYFTTTQLEPIINRVMCQLYPGYWKNQMKQKLKLRLISQI